MKQSRAIRKSWIVPGQHLFNKRSLATATLIGAGLLLAACGKVGSLDRPGGDWEYPQQYPYPPAVTPNSSTTGTQTTDQQNAIPESLQIRKNSKVKTKTYGQ
ncbi:hypothetical protein WH96_02370 [Kiloniella spongiae]|uniref:Lipoprotein n=1 Tax=Kiloniella spongiae TaxID=1489064 RepID=A0A0H2MJI1_9PROT|nr:hypothetical protein [Kiloniella spongiae]KLN62371.1 hypothetical protein WH96_02370 [Kiloniella spongiae]